MSRTNDEFIVEQISDECLTYCRIHRVNIDSRREGIDRVIPAAFDPTPFDSPDGLSVNWNKYSDAQKTKDDVTMFGKNPDNYGVVSFLTKSVREIPLRVIHKPTGNRAHSLILDIPPKAENDAKKTLMLKACCKWEIIV